MVYNNYDYRVGGGKSRGYSVEYEKEYGNSKIKNYSEDLAYFNKVSDANWYGTKYWSEVDNTITTYWNCDVLNPDYTGSLTGEALEEQRVEARAVTGRFGFVMGDEWGGGLFTPYDTQRSGVFCKSYTGYWFG